jgi:hypothetical protein
MPQLQLPMWTKAVMAAFICFHALIELILALHMHRDKLCEKESGGNKNKCAKFQLIFSWCCRDEAVIFFDCYIYLNIISYLLPKFRFSSDFDKSASIRLMKSSNRKVYHNTPNLHLSSLVYIVSLISHCIEGFDGLPMDSVSEPREKPTAKRSSVRFPLHKLHIYSQNVSISLI